MIVVEKIYNNNELEFPNIKISDGINSFIIGRNGFPDLVWMPNWQYNSYEEAMAEGEDIIFKISEEDGNIHTLFNKLYQDIISGNTNYLISDRKKEENKKIGERDGLIKGDVITFISSDTDEPAFSSVLTIKKIEKDIEIIFSKNKRNLTREDYSYYLPTYLVRISNSWSIHLNGGFINLFSKFLRDLQALDWEPNLLNTETKKTL